MPGISPACRLSPLPFTSESSNLSLVVYTFSRAAILLFGALPLNSYEYFAIANIAIEMIVSSEYI